jgi:hypothetical protein
MEMEIDGVGGVSILAKAKVFRYGCHFPAFSFEKHAETEGFGKVRPLSPVICRASTNSAVDGTKDGDVGGGLAALYHMASLRAQRR